MGPNPLSNVFFAEQPDVVKIILISKVLHRFCGKGNVSEPLLKFHSKNYLFYLVKPLIDIHEALDNILRLWGLSNQGNLA